MFELRSGMLLIYVVDLKFACEGTTVAKVMKLDNNINISPKVKNFSTGHANFKPFHDFPVLNAKFFHFRLATF